MYTVHKKKKMMKVNVNRIPSVLSSPPKQIPKATGNK